MQAGGGAEPPRRDSRLARSVLILAVMTDIVFVLVTVAFFAIAAAYTRACDRL